MSVFQQPPYGGARHEPPTYDLDDLTQVRASRTPWVLLGITLAISGAGGYWLYQDRANALSLARAGALAEKANRELEESSKNQAEKIKVLENEKAELEATRDALKRDVEKTASELAEIKGTYDKLSSQMKDEIAKGDILLTTSEGRLRVDMVDKILFGSGAADISKKGEGVLARIGSVLASIDDKEIQVLGHTDNDPISDKLKTTYPTNWELSVARATEVVRFLQEKAGVPAKRLVASGHGEYRPVASNKTSKGQARNRRIEILLTPALAPKRISTAKLKQQGADAEPSGQANQATKSPSKKAAR
jgi:chemotaxis protein MotB